MKSGTQLRLSVLCMYVCMYVCVYINMCMRMYICICTAMFITAGMDEIRHTTATFSPVYVCMYVCMYACMHVCDISVRIHIIHTYTYKHMHIYRSGFLVITLSYRRVIMAQNTYMHIYIYIHTYTYIHIHTLR